MQRENRHQDARTSATGIGRLDGALPDQGFLVLVVALSAACYVHRLGFTSDDWAFLSAFNNSHDASLLGLMRALFGDHLHPRPVQVVQLASLYWLFGLNPFGYHLVQTAVLALTGALFYLVLRELQQPRLLALAAPAVYMTLPSYSAARFWYAACTAALSVLLYFLSLYADLRSMRARPTRFWVWRVVSLFALLASTLAYEIVLPLFVVNPYLARYHARQPGDDPRARRMRGRALAAGTLIALVAVTAYKACTWSRLVIPDGVGDHLVSIARRAISPWFRDWYYGFNVWQAIDLHFGDYGTRLPRVVWRVMNHYADAATAVMAGVVGLAVFVYLGRAARESGEPGRDTARVWLMPLIAGPVVFALGYAIFLTNSAIQFTPTGVASRTAIGAAIGASLTFVGIAGSIVARVRSATARARLFGGIIASLCASGVLILNTIASFYVAAYRQEQAILAGIRGALPTLPSHSTLILDGACPYIGPGVVFESSWDLRGALRIMYGDPTLQADVVTPRMSVGEDALRTTIYVSNVTRHPYERLVIFHSGLGLVRWIAGADEARRYFREFNPDLSNGCPRGMEGRGVSIFSGRPLTLGKGDSRRRGSAREGRHVPRVHVQHVAR
jgi:hypothetical protein